jgi:Immunity protein 8
MKQILKSIFLFEAVSFLEFVPEIPHNFHVLVSLTIGSEGEAGGSDYSIGVCTPTWLDHHIQNRGPLSGRHLLIVNRFDAAEIRAHIEKIISQCEREDPAEANAVLGRFFAWEFEDYQP